MNNINQKGPYQIKLKKLGPYKRNRGNTPCAWFYRDDKKTNIHIQVDGEHGLMHYYFDIKNPRRKA